METTSDTPAQPPPPEPRRLTRTSRDRVVGGVCGGLGRYFGIDPTLVRIGFVALALFGGAGLVVYGAALLLVPLDEEGAGIPSSPRDRVTAVLIAGALVLAALLLGSFGFLFGGAFVPLAFLALAGLAVWWVVFGERPSGGPADVARRAALGVALLIGCFALAAASFFASGMGGGVVVASIVIAAGAALVAAAFVGGARWLVLPALAVALPLAFVAAAGIDLEGGFGERRERPATLTELRDGYRLGAGQLVIDLRAIELPPGDHPLKVRIGAGHAVVLVPQDVCVASSAQVGVGAVGVFNRTSGGIDVDWADGRRALPGNPRLVLEGDIGLGMLEVSHEEYDRGRGDGPPWRDGGVGRENEHNSGCATSA